MLVVHKPYDYRMDKITISQKLKKDKEGGFPRGGVCVCVCLCVERDN